MADIKSSGKPVTEASAASGKAYAPAPTTERWSATKIAGLTVLIAAAILYPWVFNFPYQQHVAILVFMYGLMAVGWNILGGYTGQVSLGNSMFFGVGAYSTAVLLKNYLISPWGGLIVGIVLSVLLALLVGWPTFRLGGHYFAIATIALSQIVYTVVLNTQQLGAAVGVTLPLLPDSIINMEFSGTDKRPYYYIILAFLAIGIFTVYRIERSKWGFYFRAIREDPVGARALGVNIQRYKLLAFVLSAIFTSMAGTFYAQYILFVDPESTLVLQISILMCLMAVLGGVGTLWGPLIGSIILIVISEGSRVALGGTGQALDLVIYGFLVMAVAVYQPKGLMGLIQRFTRRRS